MFGVDFDGTMADTNAAKAGWIRQRLGLVIPPWACDRTSCVPIIGGEQYDRMAADVYSQSATMTVQPVEGAIDGVKRLAAVGDVVVITGRKSQALSAAVEWIEGKGLRPMVRDVITCGVDAKATVALRIGCSVLIDDDVRHAFGTICSPLRFILLKIGLRESVRMQLPFPVCDSWPRAIEFATEPPMSEA